ERTIEATRTIALADSTEEPPNFITIMKEFFPLALMLAPSRIHKQGRPAAAQERWTRFGHGLNLRNFVERGLSSGLRVSISPSADHQRRAARIKKTNRTMRTMPHATFVASRRKSGITPIPHEEP